MAAMLMGAWSLQSCDNGPTKEVWLDEFGQDSCYVQDWGMLEVNRSVVHTPLTVNGVVYERGLGAHSISRLLYDLDGKAVSISGLAGADDKNLFAGKLQFKILGDKKELWKSGVMQKGDPVKEFNVNLKGVDKVLLLVEECGDQRARFSELWPDFRRCRFCIPADCQCLFPHQSTGSSARRERHARHLRRIVPLAVCNAGDFGCHHQQCRKCRPAA